MNPSRTLHIGNGAGFLGDQPQAPSQLVTGGNLDVLTLEYLAELTLSILASQRRQHPELGYARDFLTVLTDLAPQLAAREGPRVVTNAGGVHVAASVRAAAEILMSQPGGEKRRIGSVDGDDLTDRIDELLAAGYLLAHQDTGQPLRELGRPVVSAHAYLGAEGIADVCRQEADVVITGRVADASLTLGPALAHFGWSWDDWNVLAGASVAGHLIECGAQVTGGYSVRWQDVELTEIGYPIAELDADGTCVITKPAESEGRVDRLSVVEQLLYEIGDPSCYLTPDVTVDMTAVDVTEIAPNRVQVRSAQGTPPPDRYKVSLAYADGYTASAQLLIAGRDCIRKGERCAELIFARLRRQGLHFARQAHELLGTGRSLPGQPPVPESDPPELVLRLAVQDPRREAVQQFTRQIAPLVTSGPAGISGYAVARSPVRPVFAFWPTTIPRELVTPRTTVRSAKEWVGP
jgi:hypothetical protein